MSPGAPAAYFRTVPARIREKPRPWIAVVLLILSTSVVVVSQRSRGLARDEVVYMHHGTRYADWWMGVATFEGGRLNEESITKHFGGKQAWANNREHPPLMKTLFGLSKRLLHDKLGWASEITAYRFPTAFLGGVLVAMVFLFVSAVWGLWEGLFAALLSFLMPRWFYHAGLATFDAPIVTFWFAAVVAYYRSFTRRWAFIWLGVCVGLCLATKHNAIMLPAVFFPHVVWVHWMRRGRQPETPFWRRYNLHQALAVLVIGPLVAIALWPWLWFDTAAHVRDWIGFHLSHVHYNFEYLGKNWNAPPFPWHVPIVTTLLVVPVTTLWAAGAGATALVWRWRFEPDQRAPLAPGLLLFLSAGVAMGPFLLTSTPIFGSSKHWTAAITTLAIFAGIGVPVIARAALRYAKEVIPSLSRGVWAMVAVCALLAPVAEVCHSHPYGLSHYTALAGGPPGGADLGMNRQYWGVSAKGVLPFIGEQNPAGPVYSHNASPVWGHYQRAGLLEKESRDSGREEQGIAKSKIAIVIHQLHFARHDFLIWKSYRTVQPRFVLTFDGVPLVSVYVRENAAGTAPVRPLRPGGP
jgi:hypothetical protein